MLLGAVDLGSNSFRVEIGRLEGDSIHTQNYLKETVRLAGGFDDKGALTPEIQARALPRLLASMSVWQVCLLLKFVPSALKLCA